MNRRNLYLILLLFLAACAAPQTTPAATATLALSTASPTAAQETPLPTITPTLAIIPTRQPEAFWTNPIDGAVTASIPAGEFLMGTNEDPDPACDPHGPPGSCLVTAAAVDEQPQFSINVEAFWIYTTEVTNAQYNLCIAGGGCTPPDSENVRYTVVEYAQHPVVYVTWFQARDYCQWAGGRLPTEPEWEKAARGGLEDKLYPWGDQSPVCDLGAINGANDSGCFMDVLPVGSFSPNGYGLFDMAGNVSEWVSSTALYYPYRISYEREDPGPKDYMVIRGGSFDLGSSTEISNVRVTFRPGATPDEGRPSIGFRCVIPVEP